MEKQARPLRSRRRASTRPAHNLPESDHVHPPRGFFAPGICSSTRPGPQVPTDARLTPRPFSSRYKREAEGLDSCVALVLPQIVNKAVSLQSTRDSLEPQLHL